MYSRCAMKLGILIFVIIESTVSSPRRPSRRSDYSSDFVRLNKYISNSGVCARREADRIIKAGLITVDGSVVRTLGVKIPVKAVVTYRGKRLRAEKMRYILLNKPKGYVTTVHDPEGRRTVLRLIDIRSCPERIYPVGRLDYSTTGLLLLTNDGDLARNLSHPSSKIEKYYHVVLNKSLQIEHFESIRRGLELEDGFVKVDQVNMMKEDPTQVGIMIHMGRNRVIRRMFHHLGYEINSLDRVGYAHLTKQNVPRGKWIFLSDREVDKLKNSINT